MNREIMNGGFKIGDRVECIKKTNYANVGTKGIIKDFIKDSTLVEWDIYVGGNTGRLFGAKNLAKDGYGEWKNYDGIKLVGVDLPQHSSIHITTDGKTTTGIIKQGKEVIKKVEAKLYPKDEFNFEEGSKIVMARLFEKEKEVGKEKPHLIGNFGSRENYGAIGEETDMVDIFGAKLFIGDVVVAYKYGKCYKPNFVCKCDQYGVMGLISIGFNKPESVDGWVIKKVKSYKSVRDGQTIGDLRVVL